MQNSRGAVLTRRAALVGGAAALGAGLVGAAPARAANGVRRFAVIRDGDEIGEHTLTLSTRGDVQEMRIYILIEVFVIGIRAYVYEHRNTEIWRAGRLERMTTTTNNDGDEEFCSVERVGDQLRIDGTTFSGLVSDDRAPTSYWRKAELPWFSSQTGKQLRLTANKNSTGRGERWRVTGNFNVTLDYDADGEWRGCEFPSSGGETIRYRQVDPGPRFNG